MKEEIKQQILETIKTHKEMISEFESAGIDTIASAADMIIQSLQQGGCVYICGNGGSAADAQHIAGEFVGRFKRERRSLAAVALTTDTSVITSISNDYSYESIFSKQVEAFVKKGDILWALSTSGCAANVIAAVDIAKEKGAKILAFTGKRDSELEKKADICFCAEDELTARSQEIHQLAYHIICDLVEQNFAKD